LRKWKNHPFPPKAVDADTTVVAIVAGLTTGPGFRPG
jgi:hypothetical protein